MSQEPKILSKEELPTDEAKWITLKNIEWTDQDGQKVCETTGSSYDIMSLTPAFVG